MAQGKHAAPRTRRIALLVVVALVVVALVAGVLALVLSRDDAGGSGGSDTGTVPDDTVPEFSFRTTKTLIVPTTATTEKKLKDAAKTATSQVVGAMDQLYTQAFLNPANWRTGTYDSIYRSFADGSAEAAESDLATLTVGRELGASFETIQPAESKAKVKVLFDDDDKPAGASAAVEFKAYGTGAEDLRIVSTGTYLLTLDGGHWRITSFKVRRADKRVTPKPSSGSTGAEGGTS